MTLTRRQQAVLSGQGAAIAYKVPSQTEARKYLRKQMLWLLTMPALCLLLMPLLPTQAQVDAELARVREYADIPSFLRRGGGDPEAAAMKLEIAATSEGAAKGAACGLLLEFLFLCAYASIGSASLTLARYYATLPLLTPETRTAASILSNTAELAAQMNIPAPEVRLARQDSHAMPSVTEGIGRAVLVVPMGFLVIQRKDPAAARAVIAHELGHLREKDVWLFSEAISYSRWILFVLWPGTVAAMIVPLALRSPVYAAPAAVIALFWHGAKMRTSLAGARRDSELRADAYAAIYGDGRALARFLRTYVSGGKRGTQRHPPPAERAAEAERLAAYLEAPDVAPATPVQARKKRRFPWRPGQ